MSTTAPDRITRTPGVCGGRARIAGHRVRVLDIVAWSEHQGMTPDEIVSHVPSLSLAYYFDHFEEIQEKWRAEQALANESRRTPHLNGAGPLPSG